MMKTVKSLYSVLCLMIGICALSGCIEEYEASISEDDSHLLVVEGTICSADTNRFYLSRTQPLNSSNASLMVTGAVVSVLGSDGSEYMTQANGNCYSCWIGSLSPDVEYYLHIEADGEIYESEPQKPLPTEKIAVISGVQNTPGDNIDVLITPDAPFDSDHANYYIWTYDETWEVRPQCTTFIYFDIEKMEKVDTIGMFPERGWKNARSSDILVGASTNYEGQHIEKLKLYDINRGDERILHKYSGLVRQRAISKAEYEYELARRQAGSEMGGLFTPLPSALPTNIHCLTSHKLVIGFVGCSLNISEYRFFLYPYEFSIYRPYLGEAKLWLEDCTEADCLRLVRAGMFLCEWFDERMFGGQLKTAWAFLYQLDVRVNGAYIEEPDFWSLQENVSY